MLRMGLNSGTAPPLIPAWRKPHLEHLPASNDAVSPHILLVRRSPYRPLERSRGSGLYYLAQILQKGSEEQSSAPAMRPGRTNRKHSHSGNVAATFDCNLNIKFSIILFFCMPAAISCGFLSTSPTSEFRHTSLQTSTKHLRAFIYKANP